MNNTEDILCRLCAAFKPLNKLIDLQTDVTKCEEVVAKLTRFNVHVDFNDNIIPKVVCLTCSNSLYRAYDFITAVEQAQSALNDLILVQQIKKEKSVSDDENFDYEGPVSRETDISIKVEFDKADSSSKCVSNIENSIENNEKKNSGNSLDALPLSQLKLTWDDYSWLCSYCDTQFPNINELRTHSMQFHNACNPYRCGDCKRRKLRLDNFLVHVKRHRKYLKFSCYNCPAKFSSVVQSAKHKAVHQKSSYICFGCNTNFSNEDELYKHASTYYKESRTRDIPMAMETDGKTCKICGKTCSNKANLSSHLLIHTERKKDHTCEICGKCYFQKASLAEHMVGHSDARPFQCEICKSAFKTKRMLRLHTGVHDGKKPFTCSQCGRCFRLKRQLVDHSIIHTDSLPYVCSYCNKAFRFSSILSQHIRQHTGVKPYSCDICKRDFTNWPNYNKHMKRRHGMNMAKKKITVDGTIDPVTGEIVYPEANKIDWKNKMLEEKTVAQPKLSKDVEKMKVDTESNNN